jgi:hypothetical protein
MLLSLSLSLQQDFQITRVLTFVVLFSVQLSLPLLSFVGMVDVCRGGSSANTETDIDPIPQISVAEIDETLPKEYRSKGKERSKAVNMRFRRR